MGLDPRKARRVKLRDLQLLLAVGEAGSITRAAKALSVSHPVVSKTISELERTLGVPLFDRGLRGVVPTQYGKALLECGKQVLDDLERGIKNIEFLTDPAAGELRIGATEPVMIGPVLAAIRSMVAKYPRVTFRTQVGDTPALHQALRQREVDVVVSRFFRSEVDEDDYVVSEKLFLERLFVVAGPENRWARRRKLGFSELLQEPWVMPEYDNAVGMLIAEGFRSARLRPIKPTVVSNSMGVRTGLVIESGFLTLFPGSMLHFCAKQLPLNILPVSLPMKPQSVEAVTLQNMTPAPVAALFLKHLRTMVKSLISQG
jgi:DNA-binding transcriptional LysR family regulator